MSAITELRIGAARAINLGNFEGLRIEGSLVVAIEDGDDIGAVKARAQGELNTLLRETYIAQHKAKQEKAA